MPTLEAPQLDGQELAAPSFTQAHYLYAPQLDGQAKRAPSILNTTFPDSQIIVAGTDVTAISRARRFEEQLADTGTFSFQMLRTDFLASPLAFDDEVEIRLHGVARFRGTIEDLSHAAKSSGEAADQIVTVGGRGQHPQGIVWPSRGPGALPIEDVRSYSWVSADYSATASGWPHPKTVNFVSTYADTETRRPNLFPNIYGRWIWGNVPGVTALDAPQGINLFRQAKTLASTKTIRFFFAGDNVMRLWIDGAEITWFAGSSIPRYVDVELGAGGHIIAAKVANKTDVAGEDNPAGFILAAYTLTSDGLLDDLWLETDSDWRVLPYPVRAPGFTVGKVIRIGLEENEVDDEWDRDFTDSVDSGGNPWTYQREVTLNVGRSLLDAHRELMDVHADIATAPGAKTLRAWNRGTRGRVTDVVLQHTTNPATSDFLSLNHRGQRARVNKWLIRYADGHTTYEDASSIAEHGERPGYLEVGHITDEEVAQEYAASLTENRGTPSWSTAAILHPRSDATTPYKAFEVGDWITCPNESGENELMRVASIAWTPDENGVADWAITLRDRRMEIDQRLVVGQQRVAMGIAVTGARVGSRAGTPSPTAQQVTALKVAEFSFDNEQLETGRWPKRPAEESGNIVEVYGQLTTAGTTTTAVEVYKNSTLMTTLNFSAGDTEDQKAVDLVAVKANVDKLWIDCTVAGTGAEGLNVQVRAI